MPKSQVTRHEILDQMLHGWRAMVQHLCANNVNNLFSQNMKEQVMTAFGWIGMVCHTSKIYTLTRPYPNLYLQ